MTSRKTFIVAAILFLGILLQGGAVVQAVNLDLAFSGLDDLGPGWAYEGWLIVGGTPETTGTFTVDGGGTPSQTSFNVGNSLDTATAFVLTIEPSPDPFPADPSDTHLLAGDLTQGVGTLTVGHPAALGNDFLGAAGGFVLAVPSDHTGGASHTQGIWWLDPAGGPGPSLALPVLPPGWVYEGWVVGGGGPVSTGTFTAVSGADSDGGGPDAGTILPTPPFPGQDFIIPPTDLTGFAAVISIEPSPDNSVDPFTLKPLVDGDIVDVGALVLQPMANVAGGFPTGTATPEPSSILLLAAGFCALSRRRRTAVARGETEA